jgi:membrane peptidoglycan carboxypeptidase
VWMGYPETDYVNPETGANELWPMNENGRLVHGRPATGGSIPATIWRDFMEVASANLTGEFVQPTPEQIRSGEALNEGVLQTPEETTPPPPDGGGGPDWSIPDLTLPTTPGRPGGTTPTTRPGQSTTTTTDPDDTQPTTSPPSTGQGPGGASP